MNDEKKEQQPSDLEIELLHHLGAVLYSISDMQSKYRCKAVEQAQLFYNENCKTILDRVYWEYDPMIADLDEE